MAIAKVSSVNICLRGRPFDILAGPGLFPKKNSVSGFE